MKRYGLIGYPLEHSFSARYFAEKFQQEGIDDCTYEPFPLASIDELPQLLENNPGLEGLNVTVPYKEVVIPFLDELDEVAERVGAVNTVKIASTQLQGFNTDVIGFEQCISPVLLPQHQQALVLGTGGASKAVGYVLEQKGLAVAFVSRDSGKGDFTYDNLGRDVIAARQVIVNTTPVGMYPDTDQCPPLPYEALTPTHLLVDLVYNPPETVFMKMGQAFGAMTMNGYEMLRLQAEASWRIWQNA